MTPEQWLGVGGLGLAIFGLWGTLYLAYRPYKLAVLKATLFTILFLGMVTGLILALISGGLKW